MIIMIIVLYYILVMSEGGLNNKVNTFEIYMQFKVLTEYIFYISVEFHIVHSMPYGQMWIKTNHGYIP